MRRERAKTWTGWQEELSQLGFVFHTPGEPYWNADACYVFDRAQIDQVEAATNTLHELCTEAIEIIMQRDWYARLRIPVAAVGLIERAWKDDRRSLYARFDLAWNGGSAIKMFEYNADTPTSLLEAAVAQWMWLKKLYPEHDQFNSIHEKLIARWPEVVDVNRPLHFSCLTESVEDVCQTEYLRDTAVQAGCRTFFTAIHDVGWLASESRFVDLANAEMEQVFKLYPWEWLVREQFGAHLAQAKTRWVEPAWKMLLSNKGLLAILWELFPNHPLLLPAFFDPPASGDFIRKPMLSREGANVARWRNGQASDETEGPYGDEAFVYQAYHELPRFGDRYPVIGSWIVGEVACGMGIREDQSPITQNMSQFVPHYFTE